METGPSVLLGAGGSLAAAAVGSLSARRAPEVYGRLDKPSWAPPASVFGPVWTTLYTAMGVAAFRLARRGSRRAVRLHLAQLAVNAVWPGVFFSAGHRRAALGVIVVLDGLVAAEIAAAARSDRVAARLLCPYLAWCLFATALNAAVGEPAPHTSPGSQSSPGS